MSDIIFAGSILTFVAIISIMTRYILYLNSIRQENQLHCRELIVDLMSQNYTVINIAFRNHLFRSYEKNTFPYVANNISQYVFDVELLDKNGIIHHARVICGDYIVGIDNNSIEIHFYD